MSRRYCRTSAHGLRLLKSPLRGLDSRDSLLVRTEQEDQGGAVYRHEACQKPAFSAHSSFAHGFGFRKPGLLIVLALWPEMQQFCGMGYT